MKLYHLPVSPWSERARWSLYWNGIQHQSTEHLVLIGELSLRSARRTLGQKITAPSMVLDDGSWLTDSWEIARWADTEAQGRFFRGQHKVIEGLQAHAERFLTLLRPVVLERMVRAPKALEESLPGIFPSALHRPLRLVGALGVRYLLQKYERPTVKEHEIFDLFDCFRKALQDRDTVLEDGFSYGDILIATALQMIKPAPQSLYPIGQATRDAWTLHAYCEGASDLLEWRDRVYQAYRMRTHADA